MTTDERTVSGAASESGNQRHLLMTEDGKMELLALADLLREFICEFWVDKPTMKWRRSCCDDSLEMVHNEGDSIFFGDPNHQEPPDTARFDLIVRLANSTPELLVAITRLAASLPDGSGQRIVQEDAHATKQSLSGAEDSATETAVSTLLDTIDALIGAVEGIDGAMNYGSFRSERGGYRLKDTKEWVAFYVAWHRANNVAALKCVTCSGLRAVGGFDGAENSYRTEPCPDCAPANAARPYAVPLPPIDTTDGAKS